MGRKNNRNRNQNRRRTTYDEWGHAWPSSIADLEREGHIHWQPDTGTFLSNPRNVKKPETPMRDNSGRIVIDKLVYKVHIRINCIDGPVRLIREEHATSPHTASKQALDFLAANLSNVGFTVTLIHRDKRHWTTFAEAAPPPKVTSTYSTEDGYL